MSSVLADVKKPVMKVTNRWEYLERYIPVWKNYIRYRMYTVVFGLVGVTMIFTVPPLGVVSLAAATYYWGVHLREKSRLESQRSVLIGH